MKSKFKKSFLLVVMVMLVTFTGIPAYAKDNESTDTQIVETNEIGTQNALHGQTSAESVSTWGLKYKFKTIYYPDRYIDVSFWAAGQDPGGYNLPNGGALYYAEDGGIDVSFSFSVSAELFDGLITISGTVDSGQYVSSSAKGVAVKVPADNNYYKLYVTKTMKVSPYVTFRAQTGTDDWEVYYKGAASSVYSLSLVAKQVANVNTNINGNSGGSNNTVAP